MAVLGGAQVQLPLGAGNLTFPENKALGKDPAR